MRAIKLNEVTLMLMRSLRNGFESDDKIDGTFTIDENVEIALPPSQFEHGDWVAIAGPRVNGVFKLHQATDDRPYKLTYDGGAAAELKPRTFEGTVWRLDFPPGFEQLAKDIAKWLDDPANAPSNVVSESEQVIGFDAWSVTRATGADGKPLDVLQVFGGRINDGWRRIFIKPDGVLSRLGG